MDSFAAHIDAVHQESTPTVSVVKVGSEKFEDRVFLRPKRESRRKEIFDGDDDDQQEKQKRKKKRFHCTLCTSKTFFASQKRLRNHMAKVHEKKSNPGIVCEICSSVLKSELYFKRHMTARHPATPKVYICDFDGRTYNTKDYIRIHMDRHRRYQILTCETCQKNYTSKHTFRKHLLIVR